MTEQLITTYPTKIESLTLVPADGGRFELTVNGDLVFSKLAAGRFPEWDELKPEIDKRAG